MTAPFLICVGNAIVDILVKVEDSFLKSNDLIKGSMSLVNSEEFDNIFSKISKYKKRIISMVSKLCKIKKDQINIKGKTAEKLGVIGKEKAIACEVISSVFKYE